LDDQAAALDAQVRLIEEELERRMQAHRAHEPPPPGAMAAWGTQQAPWREQPAGTPAVLPQRPMTSAGARGGRPVRPQSAAPTRRKPHPPSPALGESMPLASDRSRIERPRPVSAGPRLKVPHGRRASPTLTGSSAWYGGEAPSGRRLPEFEVRPFGAEQGPLSGASSIHLPAPPPSARERMKQLIMIYGSPAASPPRLAGRLGGGSRPASAGGRGYEGAWHSPGSRRDATAQGGRKHSLATEYIPLAWNGGGVVRRSLPVAIQDATPPPGSSYFLPPEGSGASLSLRPTVVRSAW
jgi:hypothetical protein